MNLKRCFRCGKDKPRTEFYAHKQMADGLLGKCKECTKSDTRSGWASLSDEQRRARNLAKKVAPSYTRKQEWTARWRSENPTKHSAHSLVAKAIRDGVLKSAPCVVCDSGESVAHHESYARPLDVVWYCQKHHKERHRAMESEGAIPSGQL